jgi:pseudouridine-5'-phosphate glycosidase
VALVAFMQVLRTLEVLETEGVSVVGFRTDTLPAFWTSGSDLNIALRLDSAEDIAAFHK